MYYYYCRKERKIFESFQKEANAVKDKKMKDELICLKQEVTVVAIVTVVAMVTMI